MRFRSGLLLAAALLAVAALVIGHPFPPLWSNGSGPAFHHQPVSWPAEPVNPLDCGAACGDWKPYTRFRNSINDPRVQDASNGGTAPQNYVNVSSSCSDRSKPSIYYYLYKDTLDPAKDVLMFRWRVEQPAHNYATGPSAGNYSASNPWSSALWTVLFDLDGSGYRSLAAHLNGSSGSPAEAIDTLAGIWGEIPTQSIDYLNDPRIHLLGHNPTGAIGASGKLLNFQDSLTPLESWPNGASETSWDYGTTRARKVTASPCSEYFIDYQIPVALLDATAVGGPRITRETPISMLFCTANSLNNPFQKDCAINRAWSANATSPAPFGDYLSFDKDAPYQQPIVASVTAQAPNTCPGTHKLTAKVQDALVLGNGVVGSSVKAVDFYYWYDGDGDGAATVADTGSEWTRITPAAALASQSLNTWTADWNAAALPKGKYLIGVQAVDDASAVDDGMAPASVENRTFSYFSGDAQNRIYIAGVWQAGQQAQFLAHSPLQNPSSAEDWYGNPAVTGNQVALVGTAINACGVAPTLTLGASPGSVVPGATVSFSITLSNPAANPSAITLDTIEAQLPAGFSYISSTSSGATAADPSVNGQQLSWSLLAPLSVTPGTSVALSFSGSAASTAGTYNATAGAATSFGGVSSAPAAIIVDAARVSLSSSPSSYSVPADGTTPLTFTLNYSNDSAFALSNAGISSAVPIGATYVSCSGGNSCAEVGGVVTFMLGALSAGAAGSVGFTITVPNSWSTTSLGSSSTLSAAAPDSSVVTANAASTVAVTGLAGSTAPAFRLGKTANVVSVAPGGGITFTLAYENYGTAAGNSVVLTDTLPAGLSFGSCSNSCNQSSGVVTWNIGTVAAGATGTRTVTVSAANPFTAINPAVNTASISWSGGGPVTAQTEVGVTGQACSIYYFRNVTANVGFDGSQRVAAVAPVPLVADTGTTVTATAPVSGASFLEVLRFYQDPQTQNDVPFNGDITTNVYLDRANGPGLNIRATVYDYNSTTGAKTQLAQNTTAFGGSDKGLLTFAVTPSGTLAKGHRLLWVYEARSNHSSQTVQVQLQFGGTVTNGISGGSTFANSNARYCVTPPASLTLSSTVDSAAIAENTTPTLKYTLRYANVGSGQATGLSLVGALPSGFTGCQYSTDNSNWSACSNAGAAPPSHTFSIASLPGGSSGTAYVRGTVPSNTSGPATLTSTSTLLSSQTTQISAAASTQVTGSSNSGSPALVLSLSANRSSALPGQTVAYTLTVVNTGDGAASNVVLSNTLPSTAYYTYAGCSDACVNGAGTITWPTIATLAAGASRSYTYSMTVGTSGLPAGVSAIADTAGVAADGGLAVTSNSVSVSLNGNPSLQATFTSNPLSGLHPGDSLSYTLSVENTGAAPANSVAVSMTVPVYTGFVSSPTGAFDAIGNQVTFNVGTLASGTSSSVTFTARADTPLNSGTSSLISTAVLSADNAAQQILTATATATAQADLFIANDAPSSVPLPSAVLTTAAAGTTLFVDRSDRFALGQLVSVGGDVATITALGRNSISVDSPTSASSGTAVYGSLTLTITYRNDGDANATGATIHQLLPAGLAYHDSVPSALSTPILGNSGDVEWSVGTINAGASGTLRVIAFSSGIAGSFTSTATATAANAATRTADATTAIGGLSVTKVTSTPVLAAGGAATYSIVTSNSLPASVSVDVTDILPEGFSYQDGSALVGGMSIEPTFTNDDTGHARPLWGSVQVPANNSLTITFKADVDATAGASAYQNEVDVAAPPSVGVTAFDALASTQEDVTLLAAGDGVLNGYVFRRFSNSSSSFAPATDVPLAGVRVELHKAVYDCGTGASCYVVFTDSSGFFQGVVPAGDWIVSVAAGTGDLDASWAQVAGSNNDTRTVPAQGAVTDHNGYRALGVTHLVSTNAGSGGSISPASSSVPEGDTTAFTVTPSSGYVIDVVDGCGGILAADTFTTAPITSACTVTAAFALQAHTVTANAGTGGTIGPASTNVNHGSIATFTVTPSNGYAIAGVSGCGSGTLVNNTYTTAAITAACTVSATFSINGHTVSTAAGAGGSIAPSAASVTHGATASFTVIPNVGYSIAQASGCNGSLNAGAYTTGAVSAACTVSATFAILTYTVSTSAGAGGSITPPSTVVAHGGTASFTVSPSAGYRIAGVSGCNGSLNGILYTTGTITEACAVNATFAPLGPTIATPPPARINARSLFTVVPDSLAPTALDASGAPLAVTLVDGPLRLLPGRHRITWRAQDTAGRVVTVDQQLDIWPMVSVSQDLVLDFGSPAHFDVLLNGAAPAYPYSVNFSVGGDGGLGSKHTLSSGFVTFESGTEARVSFVSLPQASAPPDHHLTVTLDPTENVGEPGQLKILLRASNFAPRVRITAEQGGRSGTLIVKDGGSVTLRAVIADPNAGDSHALQWTYPPSTLAQASADGRELSFDPARLTSGLIAFSITALDNGHAPLSGQAHAVLALRDAAPVLGTADANSNGVADSDDGWSDSGNGIPAYLNRIAMRNVLPEHAPVTDSYLIESEAGIRLRVGAAAQIGGDGGARIGSTTIPTSIVADEVQNVGGYFSFDAQELTTASKVRFVIPQRAPIPAQALYRLWDQGNARWISFAEDAHNVLESAAGEPGFCPPADSAAYTHGLTPGYLCVRLTIQDGGVNDLDQQSNAAIASTGGVGERSQSVVTGTSSGSGGGGAMNGVWPMILGLFALLRFRGCATAMCAALLLPLVASAQDRLEPSLPEPAGWRSADFGWLIGANALFVHGSVDAREMDARIARDGYTTQTDLSGQARLGGMAFVGYRRRYLGLELAYVDLGKLTSEVRGTTPISEEYLLAISRSHPQSGSGPQLSALGYLPLGERFEIVGRLGAFYWRGNMDARSRSQYEDVADRAFDPAIGVGVNYRVSRRWSATAQWTEYRLDGERVGALSLGVAYRWQRGAAPGQ